MATTAAIIPFNTKTAAAVSRDRKAALSAQLRAAWSKHYGLTRATGHQDWRRLIGKRGRYPEPLPGDDHTSLWLRDGRPFAYVSEPYQLHLDDLEGIVLACHEHGLKVSITTWPAWHFKGAVLFVEYQRNAELMPGG